MAIVSVRTELIQTVNVAVAARIGTTLIYQNDSGNGIVESNVEAAGPANNYLGRSLDAAGAQATARQDVRARNLRAGEKFVP